MTSIGKFLTARHYNLLSVTCKQLKREMRFELNAEDSTVPANEQLLYISSNINQIFFRQTGCQFFGTEEWLHTFGVDVGDVEPLSFAAYQTLNSPCPFDTTDESLGGRRKQVKETHALMYVPSKVGGKPINMEMLAKLCPSIVKDADPKIWGGELEELLLAEEQPEGVDIPDDYAGIPWYDARLNYVHCGRGVDITVEKNCWLLFYVGDDHGLIPNSRRKPFTEHLTMLSEVNRGISLESRLGKNGELLSGEGYEVLSALEVAIAATLIYGKTGARILPSDPESFSLTRYIAKGYNRTIIGQSSEDRGLFGFYNITTDEAWGVCAARKMSVASFEGC